MYRCMCSAMIDVQMIAELSHRIFACVACDVMIANDRLVPQNQPPFCFMRVDRARVLHGQNERLGASLSNHLRLR